MNERRRILLRTVPFFVVGILVFVLYLALFVNIPQMMGVIQRANMLAYSLAVLTLILETFLFALTWQYLLLPLSVKVPFHRTYAYVWIGVFADLLIPAESISGEIVKTYLMSKEPNVNPGKVVASLVGQRIFGTISTITTLFIGFLGLLALDYSMSSFVLQILVSITILSAIGFVFLMVLCVKEKWTERMVNAVLRFAEWVSRGRFKIEHFQMKVVDALRAFYKSLRTLGSKPTKLIPPIIFFVLTWLSSIAIIFLVFVSIGYLEPNVTILLLKVIIVYTLMVAIKSIPIGVPAEVGLPDIIMTTLFILFAVPPDISAAATILSRILTVWLKFFIGFGALQWLGVKTLMESGVLGKAKDKI